MTVREQKLFLVFFLPVVYACLPCHFWFPYSFSEDLPNMRLPATIYLTSMLTYLKGHDVSPFLHSPPPGRSCDLHIVCSGVFLLNSNNSVFMLEKKKRVKRNIQKYWQASIQIHKEKDENQNRRPSKFQDHRLKEK